MDIMERRVRIMSTTERIRGTLMRDLLTVIKAGHRRPEIIALAYRVRRAPKDINIMIAYRSNVEHTIGHLKGGHNA
jgi:hypothetical protein